MGHPPFAIAALLVITSLTPGLASTCLFTADWRYFVRNPDRPIHHPAYLKQAVKNATDALEQVFIPALESGQLTSNFVKVLSEQHRMLVQGRDGKSPYGGYAGGYPIEEVTPLFPGTYMFENEAEPKMLPISARGDSALDVSHLTKSFSIKIPEIDPLWWPKVLVRDYSKYHQAAPLAHHGVYLRVMAGKLRKVLGNQPQEERLLALADYLHLACNIHPFHKVNFMLFMSQVNYLLETKLNHQPISHGHLDYMAMTQHQSEFRSSFVRVVRLGW